MGIHVAITVYCAINKDVADYNNRVMRMRCHGFSKQKNIDELTVLVNPLGFDDEPLDYIDELVANTTARRITVFKAQGMRQPGSGILQFLVNTKCKWIYFSEDAHCLPLHASSVSRPIQLIEMRLPDAQMVMDTDGKLKSPDYPDRTMLVPGLTVTRNNEWGFWQRSDSLTKYFRVPSAQRNFDASIFAYQGARVGCSKIHSAYFMHHKIDGSPSALPVLDEEDVGYSYLEPDRVLPGFHRQVENAARVLYESYTFETKVFENSPQEP